MLFPPKKPKWQHSDPSVRLHAIEEIEPANTELLRQIALNDEVQVVRKAALEKLEDLADLDEIAANCSDPQIVRTAKEKSEEMRVRLLQAEGELDQHLTHLARIDATANLIMLACSSFHIPVRLQCVARLQGQHDLEQVALGQCGKNVAEVLIQRLDDSEILSHLSRKGGSRLIRRLCEEKLSTLRQPDNADTTIQRENMLQRIVDTAGRLSVSLDWELTRQRIAQLITEWQTFNGHDHRHLDKQFHEAIDLFERRYNEHLLTLEKKRRHEEEQTAVSGLFMAALKRIQHLHPSTQKGTSSSTLFSQYRLECESLLQKLPETIGDELQTRLTLASRQFEAKLERYNQELAKAEEYEVSFRKITESTRQLPASLLKELESLLLTVTQTDWQQYDPTGLKEKIAEEKYRQSTLVHQTAEERERQQELLLRQAGQLVEELGGLRKADDMAAAMIRFREVDAFFNSNEFQAVACPPDLAKRFRAERARFLVKHRDFLTLKEWHTWANRIVKQNLIAEVAALDDNDDLATVFGRLKQLQSRWKETGPAGAKQDRQLWLRFREQCERQFNRCLPYLEELEKQRQTEIERFNAIIEEAKAVSDSDEGQETAARFRQWQHEIKDLTAVPAAIKHDLFVLFRKEANAFFERRRQHLEKLAEEQQKNYQLKEELCQKAEELASAPDPGHGAEFKKLQKKWKGIGPAARKKEQQIWRRFRKACDQYFHWLDERRRENLDRKQQLLDKAAAIALEAETVDDFRPLAAAIDELQKKWKEIGPVPLTDSQRIWNLFRSHIDRFYTVRQQSLATLHHEQLENQRLKEEILESIENLAGSIKDKDATEQIKALQKKFYAIGPSPRGEDHRLRERLKTLCDNFFKGRSNYFAQLQDGRESVLREKEALLFELQKLVNFTPKPRRKVETTISLDLAAQLKLALESNFAMAERDKNQALREEVSRIRKKWKALAKLPVRQEKELERRFQETLEYYERQSNRK